MKAQNLVASSVTSRQSSQSRYVASPLTAWIPFISFVIKSSAYRLFSQRYSLKLSSHSVPWLNAATGAMAANTFGYATSSVFNPRLTRCRSTGFGTITAAVCSPARLKVFVGATQVMLFSLQVSDTEAKGT